MWPKRAKTRSAASAAGSRKAADADDGPVSAKRGRQAWLEEALAKSAFRKWNVRRNLYRRLAVRVRNGASIEDVLTTEAKNLDKQGNHAAYVLRSASRLMRNGHSLSEALGKWLPDEERGVLSASEAGKAFSHSLEFYIETKRRVKRVVTAFRNAAQQPVVYITISYFLLWSLAKYSVPKLKTWHSLSQLTGSAKVLIAVSDFVNSPLGMALPAVSFLIGLLIVWSFPRWTGRLRIQAEKHFPWSYYRDKEGFIWLSGYVSLLEVGRTDVDILARQAHIASPYVRERLLHYRRSMVNGKSLAQALSTPLGQKMPSFDFPNPDIINDIAALGDGRDFPIKMKNVLDSWAEEMEQETLEKARRFGTRMEIIMYALMTYMFFGMGALINQLVAHR
jgi:type II secretory pathway component PulF